ncbi:MAG: DUF327 family protein [Leptonema sp. (in: bacteria)]
MKIDKHASTQNFFLNTTQNAPIQKSENLKTKKILSEKKPKTSFEEFLLEVIPPEKESELFELWTQLPDIEKKLIQDPTEENLEIYQELVHKIAKQLLQKNLKIEQIKRKSSSGKEILLSYVKIIDEKLHKMMLAIQSKKNTAFEILRNLREIRGLLIDLKR